MLSTLLQARLLLDEITPLKQDCGLLCGHACCLPDEDGQGGVWLLPGEETLLDGQPWAQIIPGERPLLMCKGACQRDLRPFFCRIFPLIGVRRGGKWDVRLDRRAWAVCPLMQSGMHALSPDFVSAARKAVSLLGEDPEYAPILKEWARIERSFAASDILEAFHGAD